MKRPVCPNCKKHPLVEGSGPVGGVLLIGEFPGWQEQKWGQPFVGQSGDILVEEFGRVGGVKVYENGRVTNLWLHEPDERECSLAYMKKELMKEIRKAKLILLMGSEFGGGYLYEESVMDRSGLWTPLPYKKMAMVAPNPAMLPKDSVGEFRDALRRLVDKAKKMGLDKEDK